MYQLTHLAAAQHYQRLAAAEAQRPAGRAHWPGPPAAPNAPNGGCAALSARPGGYAPSSRPTPQSISDRWPQPATSNPATIRRSP
jgi:hypothetical protein